MQPPFLNDRIRFKPSVGFEPATSCPTAESQWKSVIGNVCHDHTSCQSCWATHIVIVMLVVSDDNDDNDNDDDGDGDDDDDGAGIQPTIIRVVKAYVAAELSSSSSSSSSSLSAINQFIQAKCPSLHGSEYPAWWIACLQGSRGPGLGRDSA